MPPDTATGQVPDTDLPAVARRLVPVGFGVFTWLLVLIAAGVLLSVRSMSLLSALIVVALGILFVPVYSFRPWQPGLTGRVLGFVRRCRRTLLVAVGLFVLVRLPGVADALGPVLGVLLFPLRAVPQVLYSVTVFYGTRVGDAAGQVLFDVGRLYAEFLWLYTVAGGAVTLLPERGEAES